MRMRPLIVCSLVLAVAASSPAAAATKKKRKPKPPPPLCYLLVDDKGDGHAQTGGAVLKSPAMDIHSADVATGGKTVVGVIRLQTTKSDNDAVAALGLEWTFSFTVRGQKYTFQRRRSTGMVARYTYSFSPNPTGEKLTVTETGTDVKFVIARKAVPELMKPGKWVLDTLAANGKVFVTNGDYSATDKKYPDKAPHCLKPA